MNDHIQNVHPSTVNDDMIMFCVFILTFDFAFCMLEYIYASSCDVLFISFSCNIKFMISSYDRSANLSSTALQVASLSTNPFGTLPAMPQISFGQAGTGPSIQYGISSIPVSQMLIPKICFLNTLFQSLLTHFIFILGCG